MMSPNFSSRKGYKPEAVVIHIMAGSLAGTDDWFNHEASQVSAHYGIGNKGEIHNYVDEVNAAWANGRVIRPTWKLLKPGINPNLYTLSIEHEGTDLSKASNLMKATSAALIANVCKKWNIPIDRDHIIGHYQIFADKPNCPATNKSIIDELVRLALTVK